MWGVFFLLNNNKVLEKLKIKMGWWESVPIL